MTVIKPISDLRNKANAISELAHKSDEPVMSMAQPSKLLLKLELFSKLAVAQAQRASGDKGRTLTQTMKDLRKHIRESA
ncbi:MAG: prevent-host-death protein [Ignavibacteria bacterium]|nr:prevent-host-death protein [Ignavibacteria bacterium]